MLNHIHGSGSGSVVGFLSITYYSRETQDRKQCSASPAMLSHIVYTDEHPCKTLFLRVSGKVERVLAVITDVYKINKVYFSANNLPF